MIREDIYGGLKNALDRGEDLEKAVRTFVNAGYPESDVREAAQAIASGNRPSEFPEIPQIKNIPKKKTDSVSSQRFSEKKGLDWKLIGLSSLLIILILILIVSFFFKEEIIIFFTGLL